MKRMMWGVGVLLLASAAAVVVGVTIERTYERPPIRAVFDPPPAEPGQPKPAAILGTEQSASNESPTTTAAGPSPCGSVDGDSRDDVFHARYFCSQVIGKEDLDEFVVAAYADGPILRLNVTTTMATAMLQDRSATEAAVLRWMNWWKGLSGEQAVVVRVLLNDRTIARGRTTALSGDQVTVDG